MLSSRVKILLTWCNENGIQIDPRIQVRESRNHQELAGRTESSCSTSSRDRGISVYSLEHLIDCSCSLVRIPKATILSTKSCFFSQDITSAPYGHAAHLALALALYGEILRGQDSKWFGYLQSLPREIVDIAIFWGVKDVIDFRSCVCSSRGRTAPSQSAIGAACSSAEFPECATSLQYLDGKRARMWLSCAGTKMELDGLTDEIRQYYVSIVEPTLHAAFGRLREAEAEHNVNVISGDGIPRLDECGNESNSVEPSLPGFCHAYSLVSSRAFLVDAYHGLAMVPIADAFNHTNENHVHMESDFDVCVDCGSLAECDHDHETTHAVPARGACSLPGVPKPDPTLEIDTLDMCSVKPILPHSEVFNTYGSLSNAELISRYGFTLPENEHDIVSLGYGSFSAFINNLIGVVRSSADSGNDADTQGRLKIRNFSLPDCGVLGDERGIADDFASLFLRIYSHLASLWTTEPRWDEAGDTGMVYNASSVSSPWSLWDDPDSALPEAFNINSEGKLTHTLWLFCVLFATCICSPEIMTNFAHSIVSSDNEPTRQSFVEDVKRYLVDVQNYVDNARETGDDDEEVSISARSDTPSDDRDDPFIHVTQNHMTTETDAGGISMNENNVHASAQDSACFISSLHAPASRSLGLDLPSGIRAGGDACFLARAYHTNVPSVPSSTSQAMVWSSPRRRSSVVEERPPKRLRHSSPHTVVSQEDLPFDIYGKSKRTAAPVEETISTGNLTAIAGRGRATHTHRVAQTLALIVVHLCQHDTGSAHISDVNADNLTAAELGELLDVSS